MKNTYRNPNIPSAYLASSSFLNRTEVYLHHFNSLPCMHSVFNLDIEKAIKTVEEKFAADIMDIYRDMDYDAQKKKYNYDEIIIVLKQNRIIYMESTYMEILTQDGDQQFIKEVTECVAPLKVRAKKQPQEMNLISTYEGRIVLKSMEIKRTKLDLSLYYEDDFLAVDTVIQQRLRKDKDKGIVLLHGMPGTGKTTYLRYLISRIKKKVLFVSPDMAESITSPSFMNLLIDNPNCVVVIEDAENIILDRKITGSSSVSNLLNLSDGLLSDCLNVQLICSFNSDLRSVDSALLRKGRLIARYEFGKLSVDKAQRLSDSLGFDQIIRRPMTVAEITNPQETAVEMKQRTIGFRRQLTEELVN
ncbi:AAA family ATPase [Chitinophaga sp. sic0106]|uniref:AAA family ATPase n=1 Tax=Chitinophaga sp. sic0106 TaxID=2854785 RepID=UPI001C48AC4F|nr:AAA family ATPase [Chitinophaga sp. sic0106]MBV7528991.1 ATP-binding protein [Chitinophaga sp. sic0106]